MTKINKGQKYLLSMANMMKPKKCKLFNDFNKNV